MDDLLVLLGLMCSGVVLIAPVLSLIYAMSARRRIAELDHRVNELELQVQALRNLPRVAAPQPAPKPVAIPAPRPEAPPAPRPAEAPAPASEAPSTLGPASADAPAEKAAAAPPTPEPTPEPPRAPTPQPRPIRPPEPPRSEPARPFEPPRPEAPRPPPLSFEKIAIRALAGIAGLGLVAAGFFFYDLAVEAGYITPGVRYALGLVLGVAMLGGAEVLWKRDYRVPGAALSGAAVGVLYAALYAGVTRYELMGVIPTFALMAGVTATATLLAVRHESLFLAVLGAVGGYGTPIMLSTGQNKAVALFTYVALLNAGLLLASARRGWPMLVGLAGLMTLALELGWSMSFHTADQLDVGLLAPLLLGAGFGALALRREVKEGVSVVSAVAALATLMALIPWLVPLDEPVLGPPGRGPIANAIAGVGALLLAIGGLHGVARRRGWPALSLGTALATGLPMLTFTVANLEGPDPVPWALPALVLAAALLGEGIAPKGPAQPIALAVSSFIGAIAIGMLSDDWSPGDPLLPALTISAGLVALAFAQAATRRFPWAPLVGLALAALTVVVLGSNFREMEQPELTLGLGAAFTLVFLAFPFVLERSSKEGEGAPTGAWLASGLAAPAFFFPMYDAWKDAWGDALIGALPVLFGLLSLVAVRAILARRGPVSGDRDLALFTAVALLFLAAAIPIQLEDEWLTLGWALEIAALGWVRGRLSHPMLTPFALALAAAVSVRLLLNEAALDYHAVEGPVLLNWISYTWGVPALCLLYASNRLPDAPQPAPAAMQISAIFMLFALANLQVSHGFADQGELTMLSDSFVEEMTRSLVWAGFGLGLLVAGVLAKSRMVRIIAFGFLLLAAGKVFLSDLASLGGLARVGSLVGLSVFLLVAAVLFRWLDKKLEAESSAGEDP